MIMTACSDVESPIDLLHQDDSHQLMGEGEAGEGEPQVAGLFDLLGETVEGTDNEADLAISSYRYVGENLRQLFGGNLLPFHAKGDFVSLFGEIGSKRRAVFQLYYLGNAVGGESFLIFCAGISEIGLFQIA